MLAKTSIKAKGNKPATSKNWKFDQKSHLNALNILANPEHPSVHATARRFNITEATLRRAVKNNSLPKRPDSETVLSTYEETQLVGYCKNMQKLGFGLTRSGINHCIMEIVCSDKHDYPFTNKGPERAWWSSTFSHDLSLESFSFDNESHEVLLEETSEVPLELFDHNNIGLTENPEEILPSELFEQENRLLYPIAPEMSFNT
ncbi:7167_t:CDS:2 [Diversispora eburnea]|uniref:7167_t:CDS:1 n=1 Tax=Diversispora eburnea TaxID=1213867 RepID=A0A9N9B8U4_9GLOM|nr:7167_t:CDS:2 [Diversispora eburnea]